MNQLIIPESGIQIYSAEALNNKLLIDGLLAQSDSLKRAPNMSEQQTQNPRIGSLPLNNKQPTASKWLFTMEKRPLIIQPKSNFGKSIILS